MPTETSNPQYSKSVDDSQLVPMLCQVAATQRPNLRHALVEAKAEFPQAWNAVVTSFNNALSQNVPEHKLVAVVKTVASQPNGELAAALSNRDVQELSRILNLRSAPDLE